MRGAVSHPISQQVPEKRGFVRSKQAPRQTGHDDIIEPLPPLPHALQTRLDNLHRGMAAAGTAYEIRNGEKFMTAEAHERRLKVLVGDMNPEEAIAFLEKHGQYNEAILSQVSADRAFKYLKAYVHIRKQLMNMLRKHLWKTPTTLRQR